MSADGYNNLSGQLIHIQYGITFTRNRTLCMMNTELNILY